MWETAYVWIVRVLVFPNGYDPELPHDHANYGAAKIKEIKAEKDEED